MTASFRFSKTRQNGQFLAFLINFCPLKMLNETFSMIFKHRFGLTKIIHFLFLLFQVLYGVFQKSTKIWSSLSTSQPPSNVRTSSGKFKFWTNAFIIKMFLTTTESQTNLSLVLFYRIIILYHNDFWAFLYFLFIFKLWLWIPNLLK